MQVPGGSIQEAQKQGFHVEKRLRYSNPSLLKLVASPPFTSQLELPIPPPPPFNSNYSGTSPLRHLHSGDTKFGPGRMYIIIIFKIVTSFEGTSLFRGKGQ